MAAAPYMRERKLRVWYGRDYYGIIKLIMSGSVTLDRLAWSTCREGALP
jgi:hypothetical protein